MIRIITCLSAGLIFISGAANSQACWSFDINGGIPVNISLPMAIYQAGEVAIKIPSARFSSEPFVLPPFWDWRFCRTGSKGFWELESIHNKLYLKNRPDEIQEFSISHGYNIFTVNRGWKFGKYGMRIGLGCAFAHPESEILHRIFRESGNFLNTSYHLSGPVLNIGLNRRWYIIRRLFFQTEIKNTFSYVHVPLAGGHADFFTSSFYLTAGAGYDFISKED